MLTKRLHQELIKHYVYIDQLNKTIEEIKEVKQELSNKMYRTLEKVIKQKKSDLSCEVNFNNLQDKNIMEKSIEIDLLLNILIKYRNVI